MTGQGATLRLGLKENWLQFTLLAVINLLVGAVLSVDRSIVPVMGRDVFHVGSTTVLLSFVTAFGLVKGPLNLVAGRLADRYGRRKVLLAGWIVGLAVPFLLWWAPSFGWVIFANLLLGAHQGLAWTMTVTSKIDLVGPERRGLALGINEFSGYAGVSLAAMAAGLLASAYGLRPAPFLFQLVLGLLGLVLTVLFVKETLPYTRLEAGPGPARQGPLPSLTTIFGRVSWRDRTLFAASQAGLLNKVSDTVVWALVPLAMAQKGFSIAVIGLVAGTYAFAWAVGQLATGAWSDRVGRRPLIVAGMWLNAGGIVLLVWAAKALPVWLLAAVIMGAGTALLYPVLLSAVSDRADPAWRGTALGVYRLWRDGGYAVGGLIVGAAAQSLGTVTAFWIVAALLGVSAFLLMAFLEETRPQPQRNPA